jgi:hypothetical protein
VLLKLALYATVLKMLSNYFSCCAYFPMFRRKLGLFVDIRVIIDRFSDLAAIA